jgi:zinc D-Ala-D-Ala carboxypeptidase
MIQRKKKIKEAISAFAVVLLELGLMVAATAVFISAFNFADGNRGGKTASQSGSVSSAVKQPSSSANDGGVAVSSPLKNSDWQLVLVNFDNKMPDDFQNKIVHEFNVDLDSRIAEPYQKMHDAALKDDVRLWISSGYRSPEKQETLFNQEIETYAKMGLNHNAAVSQAERSVAHAGYSEHNTGLAIDLNGVLDSFAQTPEFRWLQSHAQDYGFVLRYAQDKQDITKIKFEPWHFRYVGVENAKKMNQLGMCLEEYINYLKENQTANN